MTTITIFGEATSQIKSNQTSSSHAYRKKLKDSINKIRKNQFSTKIHYAVMNFIHINIFAFNGRRVTSLASIWEVVSHLLYSS